LVEFARLAPVVALKVDDVTYQKPAAVPKLPALKRLSVSAIAADNLNNILSAAENLESFDVTRIVDPRPAAVRLPAGLRELSIPVGLLGTLNLQACRHVDSVKLWCSVTPEGISRLAPTPLESLPAIRELVVIDGTDQDLRLTARLSSLRALTLQGGLPTMPLSDDGMSAIADLKDLEALSIDGGWDVTDSGMEMLAKLRNLRRLSLTDFPRVTPKAIESITKMRGLRALELRLDQVSSTHTHAVLEQLQSLDQISDLCVHGLIVDSDLNQLAGFKNLQVLDLEQASGYTTAMLSSVIDRLPKLTEVRIVSRYLVPERQ